MTQTHTQGRLLWADTTPNIQVDRIRVQPCADGVTVWLYHHGDAQEGAGWVDLWLTPLVLRRLLAAHLASPYWTLRYST